MFDGSNDHIFRSQFYTRGVRKARLVGIVRGCCDKSAEAMRQKIPQSTEGLLLLPDLQKKTSKKNIMTASVQAAK